jgi:hypothetical protein
MNMENVTPISPACPTCGNKMGLTGLTPTCKGVIYEYLCSNDGDRLSWEPHQRISLPLRAAADTRGRVLGTGQA